MSPAVDPSATPLRIAVVDGSRGEYDMFDFERVDGESIFVRGPVLLEIGEMLSLALRRGGETVVVRVRVTRHHDQAGDGVTELALVAPGADAKRILSR